MLLAPVAAMQKVATVTSPAESLGKSPVAPVTVTGGTGRPVRLIPGSPGRVGKHGTEVSLLQQPWLSPPFRADSRSPDARHADKAPLLRSAVLLAGAEAALEQRLRP